MEENDEGDPIFGMAAIRDTRAMDLARYKNKTQQMLLEKQHTRLEHEFKHKSSKLDSEVSDLKEFYNGIGEKSPRPVVCARGLSYEQKQTYRKLRQKGLPSISLDEFDKRMKDYRHKMECQRYGGLVVVSDFIDFNKHPESISSSVHSGQKKNIRLLRRTSVADVPSRLSVDLPESQSLLSGYMSGSQIAPIRHDSVTSLDFQNLTITPQCGKIMDNKSIVNCNKNNKIKTEKK